MIHNLDHKKVKTELFFILKRCFENSKNFKRLLLETHSFDIRQYAKQGTKWPSQELNPDFPVEGDTVRCELTTWYAACYGTRLTLWVAENPCENWIWYWDIAAYQKQIRHMEIQQGAGDKLTIWRVKGPVHLWYSRVLFPINFWFLNTRLRSVCVFVVVCKWIWRIDMLVLWLLSGGRERNEMWGHSNLCRWGHTVVESVTLAC